MSDINLTLSEAAEQGNVKTLSKILELMAPHEIAGPSYLLFNRWSNFGALVASAQDLT